MRKLLPCLAILAILAFTTQASGQPPSPCRKGTHPRECHPMPPRFEHGRRAFEFFLNLREKLGLTDEQIDKLKTIKLEHAKAAIKTRAELKIKKLELRELLQAKEPDELAIKAKVKEIEDLRTRLTMNRINGRLEAQKVLTEKQLKQLRELRRYPPKPPEKIKKKH